MGGFRLITHEFEWGEDYEMTAMGDDPICERCEKPYSMHPDRVGITAEDETFGVDNSWKDAYSNLAVDW
jgi:hypothetical protein